MDFNNIYTLSNSEAKKKEAANDPEAHRPPLKQGQIVHRSKAITNKERDKHKNRYNQIETRKQKNI